MKRRTLGNTGISISELAFGGVEIGLPYGPGVRSEKDMVQEKDAILLLRNSFDQGITFYDTARMYGKSEFLIGKTFKSCRQEVQICSKCRHLRDADGNLPKPEKLVKLIRESLEESLQNLKTDYLDVLMLHQADTEILQHETICREFQEIQKEGLARAIGASTYSVAESEIAIHSGVWQVVQLPYNMLDQRQSVVFNQASEKGVGLVVRSVLLRGLLTDRGRNLQAPLEKVEQHIRQFAELARMHQMDLSEYATRFVLSTGRVSATLLGIDRQEYLDKALETAKKKPLPNALMEGAIPFPDPGFIDIPYWDRMGWLD